MTEPTIDRPRRRHKWGMWLAAGAIVLIVAGFLAYALTNSPAVPKIGDPAPGFQLTAFDGTTIDLASQLGRVVVVNFFASWCEPCSEEAADLERVWRDYQPRGVQFYGIGFKDAASKAKAFLEGFGVTYPAAVDPANRTARSYGVDRVPETFVVDRSGRIVQHFLGVVGREELSAELDRVLEP